MGRCLGGDGDGAAAGGATGGAVIGEGLAGEEPPLAQPRKPLWRPGERASTPPPPPPPSPTPWLCVLCRNRPALIQKCRAVAGPPQMSGGLSNQPVTFHTKVLPTPTSRPPAPIRSSSFRVWASNGATQVICSSNKAHAQCPPPPRLHRCGEPLCGLGQPGNRTATPPSTLWLPRICGPLVGSNAF